MIRPAAVLVRKKEEKLLRIVGYSEKSLTFASAIEKMELLGTLDEWLSQRSAKPRTAVRIRQVPHKEIG